MYFSVFYGVWKFRFLVIAKMYWVSRIEYMLLIPVIWVDYWLVLFSIALMLDGEGGRASMVHTAGTCLMLLDGVYRLKFHIKKITGSE